MYYVWNELFANLDGGFNPSQKYESTFIISPGRLENKESLKPPPSNICGVKIPEKGGKRKLPQ